MNVTDYFRSLADEVEALKNRVRNVIDDRHWVTDGEWKESVIRQVLRRQLPASVTVGRGFVVTSTAASHQLDVLIYDAAKPVLFRDGDLAFVTPDAVVGVIEVKSHINAPEFREAVEKLAKDMEIIRKHPNSNAFAALFAFEARNGDYAEAAARACGSWNGRLDFACIGDSQFLKFWNEDPETSSQVYEAWHSYRLPRLAPGYFVHNVIDAVSPQSVFSNNEVWFPKVGKEPFRRACAKASWTRTRQ